MRAPTLRDVLIVPTYAALWIAIQVFTALDNRQLNADTDPFGDDE